MSDALSDTKLVDYKNVLEYVSSGKKVTLSVVLVSDKESHSLNKEYRGKDYPTDVLSFHINAVVDNQDLSESETFYLGDIVVNVSQANRQASDYGNDLAHELSELVAHGVLHLLGVHHDGDDH